MEDRTIYVKNIARFALNLKSWLVSWCFEPSQTFEESGEGCVISQELGKS